jgi:hypothetical protein
LFSEKFYIERVQRAYEKQILAGSVSLAPLPPGNLLAKRVEAAFGAANVPFHKRTVCKRVAADIRQMKSVSELPEETRVMAEKLFAALAKAFSKG